LQKRMNPRLHWKFYKQAPAKIRVKSMLLLLAIVYWERILIN